MICKTSSSGSEKWLGVASQILPTRGRMWKKKHLREVLPVRNVKWKEICEKLQIETTPGFGMQQEVGMLASVSSCLRGAKESGILSNISYLPQMWCIGLTPCC